MTSVVRAPAPMLRRGLPVMVAISVSVAPEQEAREGTVELSAGGRVTAEARRGEVAETGGTVATRAPGEVAGPSRQSSEAAVPSPLPRGQSRREALVGRLRAADWHGAAQKARVNSAETTPMVVTGGRAVAAEEMAPAVSGGRLHGEATLEVADPRVTAGAFEAEMVTGAATVHRELAVRERGRDGGVQGQRRVAQRRQRRVEIEAEEDLRLELVR